MQLVCYGESSAPEFFCSVMARRRKNGLASAARDAPRATVKPTATIPTPTDIIECKDYADIDLDETPIIALSCNQRGGSAFFC